MAVTERLCWLCQANCWLRGAARLDFYDWRQRFLRMCEHPAEGKVVMLYVRLWSCQLLFKIDVPLILAFRAATGVMTVALNTLLHLTNFNVLAEFDVKAREEVKGMFRNAKMGCCVFLATSQAACGWKMCIWLSHLARNISSWLFWRRQRTCGLLRALATVVCPSFTSTQRLLGSLSCASVKPCAPKLLWSSCRGRVSTEAARYLVGLDAWGTDCVACISTDAMISPFAHFELIAEAAFFDVTNVAIC